MNELTKAFIEIYDFLELFGFTPYLVAGVVISIIFAVIRNMTK